MASILHHIVKQLDERNSSMDPNDHAELPDLIKERLPAAEAHAQHVLPALNEAMQKRNGHMEQLLSKVQDKRTPKLAAMGMLRQAARIFSETAAPYSACKGGCSHCCHIPVSITETEAKLISLAIGKQYKRVLTKIDSIAPAPDTPCPFLKNKSCSIYEHRPMTCRVLLNLDKDDLLCQLISGRTVPVPYVNANVFHTLYAMLSHKDYAGDIRQFFPD